ncbi:MAG TPA: energy transducer TonB [Fibrobacteria bacterium]|nr:energy transducer TonB [Fibrobacteria bacterium]
MKKLIRNGAIGLAALVLSAGVTVLIPLMNHLLNDKGAGKGGPRIVAQVALKQLESARQAEQPRRKLKQPSRAKPVQASVKAGPRFAMDLAVGGLEGAAVPVDIVNKPSGGGGDAGGESGDVDEKPVPTMPPPFRLPAEAKAAEKDAYLVLSFCVDPGGRPYDVRVAEEKPQGLGLAQAGRDALRQTLFTPAKKGGLPVSFCGLEQPFEVKFGN